MIPIRDALVYFLVSATATGEVTADAALGGRTRREFGIRKRSEARAGDNPVQRSPILEHGFLERCGISFPGVKMIVRMTAQFMAALDYCPKILLFEHQPGGFLF